MKVSILREAGYEESMLGLSLSHDSTIERSMIIAPNLAHKEGGHNKFTEMIMLWLDVTFPRGVWQEADTYRLSTKQSQSTMHTLMKRVLTQANFERAIPDRTLERLNNLIRQYNEAELQFKRTILLDLKNELPEGFLQRRVWCMSYKTFRNIYHQRINHKLPYWKVFLDEVLSNLEHPEFIVKKEG